MTTKEPASTSSTKKPPDSSASGLQETLSSVARGMQHAVNSTQEILEDHYVRLFDRFFDQDGNPKIVRFNLSPEQIVQAPLITLVPLNALVLDEMVVEMSVEVKGTEQKKVHTHSLGIDLDRTSFVVSFASRRRTGGKQDNDAEEANDTIDITMKFKCGDPPEGVARVMDEFSKAVIVRSTGKGGE